MGRYVANTVGESLVPSALMDLFFFFFFFAIDWSSSHNDS